MNKLENARIKINQIDKEVAKLFVERMNAVSDVISYKEEHNLKIFDEEREVEVIKRNTELIDDDLLNHILKNLLKHRWIFQKNINNLTLVIF